MVRGNAPAEVRGNAPADFQAQAAGPWHYPGARLDGTRLAIKDRLDIAA